MSKWDHKTPSAVIHSPQNAQKMLFSDDLRLRHLALLTPLRTWSCFMTYIKVFKSKNVKNSNGWEAVISFDSLVNFVDKPFECTSIKIHGHGISRVQCLEEKIFSASQKFNGQLFHKYINKGNTSNSKGKVYIKSLILSCIVLTICLLIGKEPTLNFENEYNQQIRELSASR